MSGDRAAAVVSSWELSAFSGSVRKDLRGLLSSRPLSSPPVKILVASGLSHGIGKLPMKASGKLESSEHSFHLKLSPQLELLLN